jgi:hypothetical protein
MPDYVPVWCHDGTTIAGYVTKTEMFGSGTTPILNGGLMTVYGNDGTTVVGHFGQGKGFIALDERPGLNTEHRHDSLGPGRSERAMTPGPAPSGMPFCGRPGSSGGVISCAPSGASATGPAGYLEESPRQYRTTALRVRWSGTAGRLRRFGDLCQPLDLPIISPRRAQRSSGDVGPPDRACGTGTSYRLSAHVTRRPASSSQSFRRTARSPSQSESLGTLWKIGFSS